MSKPNIFSTIMTLIEAYIQQVTDIAKLAGLELQLAIHSLVKIIPILVLFILMLFSFWLCLQVVGFLLLLHFGVSTLMAASIVALVQFIVVSILFLYCKYLKHNLSFPATRKQLSYLGNSSDENT